MKALTKPEKFRAMSRIYGYEVDSADETEGTQEVLVTLDDEFFDPEIGENVRIIWEEYECQATPSDFLEC